MSRATVFLRELTSCVPVFASGSIARPLGVAALALVVGSSVQAQSPAPQKPKHPPVCAQGVRVFTDPSDAPTPRDTVEVPPPDAPVRVTSPEEAEAAELQMRGRAGSVGATGVIISDETTEDGGMRRVRRTVTGIFVSADSARAQAACRK